MKMKCLDSKECVFVSKSCWYNDKEETIGCGCVQTPHIYLINHPHKDIIPIPESFQ